MKTVAEVAAYVLENAGYVSTMKLQKLVYYSQALSLVSHGRPLFDERIEAWANGPVCPALFDRHRGKYVVSRDDLHLPLVSLSPDDAACIDRVIEVLGSYSGSALSQLTHSERPWLDARGKLADGARSNAEITPEAIASFYSSTECENPLFRAA